MTLLLGLTPLLSQEPAFRVDVDVVQVLASVRDSSGHLVNDLSKEDFVLEEEGQVREITHFTRSTELPLALGLLVDTSLSQRAILEEERQASRQFFDQVLRPETDLAFVIRFDVDVELLEDLTPSRERLLDALARLKTPDSPGRRGTGTALFDAVFLAADEVLNPESSRKAMVVISDGVDFGSIVSLDRAIETAQRTDAIVYAIRYYDKDFRAGFGGRRGPIGIGRGGRGGRFPGGGPGRRTPGDRPQLPDGRVVLERLSTSTGGSLFEVTKKQSLAQILQQIEDELRSQYSIGFTPAPGAESGAFRRIVLKTRDSRLSVRCRDGYYAK